MNYCTVHRAIWQHEQLFLSLELQLPLHSSLRGLFFLKSMFCTVKGNELCEKWTLELLLHSRPPDSVDWITSCIWWHSYWFSSLGLHMTRFQLGGSVDFDSFLKNMFMKMCVCWLTTAGDGDFDSIPDESGLKILSQNHIQHDLCWYKPPGHESIPGWILSELIYFLQTVCWPYIHLDFVL